MRASTLLGLALLTIGAPAQAADDIFGEWWTPGFNARVVIFPCADKACGRITWAWEETPQGIADKSPLVGQAIFKGLIKAEDNRWEGKIYNPEDGRSYSSDVGLINTNTLEVNGCVLLFCKRQVWRRYDENRCPPIAPK